MVHRFLMLLQSQNCDVIVMSVFPKMQVLLESQRLDFNTSDYI